MRRDVSVQAPVCAGGRVIVPVVRESEFFVAGGGIVSVSPVALLIEECGEWSFVAIEEGFGLADIETLFADNEPCAGPENR